MNLSGNKKKISLKKLTSVFYTLVAIVMAPSVMYAAGSTAEATVTVTATILTTVSIEKDYSNKISNTGGDLIFGVIVPNSSSGSVSINPVNNTRSTQLAVLDSEQGAAAFHVIAAKYTCHTICLPSGPTILRYKNNTMTVDNWTINVLSGIADENGYSNFAVGATLHVEPNQQSGKYTGTFLISTAYN